MSVKMSPLKALAAFAAVGTLLAGCGSADAGTAGDSTGGASPGGSFSFAIAEPEALAPVSTCYETACGYVMRAIHVGLVRADPKSDGLEMLQADSIDTKDGKVWTVKLKSGWTFENGEPVDADAYLRAWNYGAYGPNAARANFFFERIVGYDAMNSETPTAKELSGLKKIDANTISITLNAPFSQFPQILSGMTFLPMAKACLADMTKCNEHPIGNGPYKMAGDWTHNQSIEVVRRDDYTGPNPGHAEKITFKIYPQKDAALQDLLSGQVDVISPNPDQIEAAKGQPDVKVIDQMSSGFTRFKFPADNPAYADPKVRRAISMAIDRKAITDSILPNNVPADDVISAVIPGYEKGACDACVYDPAAAKKLLEEAGGWKGGTMNMWLPASQGYEQRMEAIGNQLKKNLGISFTLKVMPQAEFYAMKSFDGPNLGTWSMDYRSPENYLRPQFSNRGTSSKKWVSADFEKIMDAADAQPKLEDAIAGYRKAADLVLKEVPAAPLFFEKAYFLHSQRVDNVTFDSANETIDLSKITVTQ